MAGCGGASSPVAPSEFVVLVRFARLAHERGVRLRPYLGYTPEWASGGGGSDGQVWNDPPRRPTDFARFAARLAVALRSTGSVGQRERLRDHPRHERVPNGLARMLLTDP